MDELRPLISCGQAKEVFNLFKLDRIPLDANEYVTKLIRLDEELPVIQSVVNMSPDTRHDEEFNVLINVGFVDITFVMQRDPMVELERAEFVLPQSMCVLCCVCVMSS